MRIINFYCFYSFLFPSRFSQVFTLTRLNYRYTIALLSSYDIQSRRFRDRKFCILTHFLNGGNNDEVSEKFARSL